MTSKRFFWRIFLLASARLQSDLRVGERGESRHFQKASRAVLTTTLHASFHHGLHWVSQFREGGWLSLKNLVLAAAMLLLNVDVASVGSDMEWKLASRSELCMRAFHLSFRFLSLVIHVGGWPVLRAGLAFSTIVRERWSLPIC
jgi:hypothetical protein